VSATPGPRPAPCPFGECDGDGFVVDEETLVATPCRCRAQRVTRARTNSLSVVIPRRYRGVSFDRPPVTEITPAVTREVRRYVSNLDANLDAGRGLWFMGDVGTGKTTLAMLVCKAALDGARSVAIYSLPRLLADIRTTFEDRSDRSYVDLLDRLAEVDLLHIDDLGAEKTSPWVLEQLYSIVNRRYEDERAVMVTTNLRPEELAEQITERTVSRLIELCGDPLPLFGPDARREHPLPAAGLG
jgi:DNA replication protein DnaC